MKRKKFRETLCAVCGNRFFPDGFKQTCCSDLCTLKTKFVEAEPDRCWPWLGKAHTGYGGYGCFVFQRRGDIYRRYGTRQMTSSRAVYLLLVGEIPLKQVIRHTCDNRWCVNPAHLVPGTRKENTEDMFSRGRASPTRGFLRWKPTDKSGNIIIKPEMLEAGLLALDEAGRSMATKEEIVCSIYRAMTEKRITLVPLSIVQTKPDEKLLREARNILEERDLLNAANSG